VALGALAAAQAQLADAQANGGDVASAQAAVAQAEAALAAAQAAESAPPVVDGQVIPQEQPAPALEEAPAEPEPQPEQPAPEAPAPEAPAEVPTPPVEAPAEAPAEVPADPQANEPVAPQGEAPAEPSPLPEAPPEIPAEDAAPAPDAPAEAPAAEPTPQMQDGTAVPAPQVAPAPEAPAEQPTPPAADQPTAPADIAPAETPPAEPPAAEPEVRSGESVPSAPAPDAPAGTPAEVAPVDGATITPEATLPVKDGAPILDSAKEAPVAAPADGEQPATQQALPVAPAAPPPTSDAEAQAVIETPAEPAPQALSERGERFDGRENRSDRRRPPENAQIIQEIDNRVIFEINNRIVIESSDSDRIRGRSENVYYERLPRGRTLEVVERRNGTQIVTIRDRWGDVVQRSKVLPDGREILLSYAPREDRDERRNYYDAGRDLPPLRLTIPVDDYILDATRANPAVYYDFLEEPPVERVERIYSIDEVRHSARIRDKVRRIDLDTLTFEFGKATIAEDQVAKLAGVADAISRILEENPAETFLIEGHTDAVGTDRANLILSDTRAETVAVALSDVFGIAPENLVAQGYGERYLKVATEEPERLNRRVTIRRITPLVTPVASR
jgi:outer membrane protein OmpA-like peptidoglycan-associated protein